MACTGSPAPHTVTGRAAPSSGGTSLPPERWTERSRPAECSTAAGSGLLGGSGTALDSMPGPSGHSSPPLTRYRGGVLFSVSSISCSVQVPQTIHHRHNKPVGSCCLSASQQLGPRSISPQSFFFLSTLSDSFKYEPKLHLNASNEAKKNKKQSFKLFSDVMAKKNCCSNFPREIEFIHFVHL